MPTLLPPSRLLSRLARISNTSKCPSPHNITPPPRLFPCAGLDVAWFGVWLKEWGKPYLNPVGFQSLWRAMPAEQREVFESMREASHDVFASEEDMHAKVEALLQESRIQQAQAGFHRNEKQYFGILASQDPAAISKKPVDPGIVKTVPPGTARANAFGTGCATLPWCLASPHASGHVAMLASP
eukprot:4423340-Pleurochrysis_carterae.AAC.3